MASTKYSIPEFEPELRVVARGAASHRMVVVFDTATDMDRKRSPRIVMIDTDGVDSIATSVDEIGEQDHALYRVYTGQINLITKKKNGEQEKYLLSDFELKLENNGKRDKDGHFVFPTSFEVEQTIRQGVADAFTDASLEMAVGGDVAPVVGWDRPVVAGYAAPAFAAVPERDKADAAPSRMSKKMLAFMALLTVLLVAAVLKIMSTPSDPLQAAVNRALANDPAARDEQIEITRQTLREMGLDPGKNGDLGCLVPPS